MSSNTPKVAVVTGGMGGLGEAICKRLSESGLTVVAAHSPGNRRAGEWLERMSQDGYPFAAQAMDVASFASCREAFEEIRRRHGPVSVLVNNAGITRDVSFRKMSEEDWQTVLRTNLDSMFNVTKPLAVEFAKKNITVNTVSPGYLHTAMVSQVPKDVMETRILPEIPVGRLGEPDEVAQLVSYLASERAAFITGANISINGGQHMY